MTFDFYHRNKIFAVGMICLMVCAPSYGFAQTPPLAQIPSSADPGRILDQAPDLSAKKPLDVAPPIEGDNKKIEDLKIPGAETVFIKLKEIKYTGITVYDEAYLQSLSKDIIGHRVTLKDIVNILNALNQRYRNDGYIFSRAYFPEQDITEGIVEISVEEGYVHSVSVENPRYEYSETLNVILRRIASMKPFNIHAFEKDMLTLNNLAGSGFKSVLKSPDQEKLSGALDIVLIESEEPTTTVASFDNYGSQYAGPTEVTLARTRYYTFLPYDQLDLQVFGTVPTSELRFAQIGYSAPVPSLPGLKLLTNASYGRTIAGSNLRELDVNGFTRELKVGASYTLPINRVKTLSFDVILDAKNTQSDILDDNLYDDRIRALRVGTSYQESDKWDGASFLRFELSKGLNILGARPTGSENLSRADGASDFTKIYAQLTRLQNVAENVQVVVQIAGQYAFDPVLSSEEFGFGGGSLGRGYDPSEITGDHGIAASLELRYNHQPVSDIVKLIQPYMFYDLGQVWQKGDTADNASSAASAGLGSRFYLLDDVSANFAAAWPLTMSASNPPKYASEDGVRFLFSITKNF